MAFHLTATLNPTDHGAPPASQSHLTKTRAEMSWLAQLRSIQAEQVRGAIEMHVL